MKIVVYTAIFGNYDQLLDPLIAHDDIDFVYFSEKKIPNLSTWLFRPLKKDWGCPIKNNRYCKMHPHALFKNDNYEASIYLDANILVVDSWFYNRAFNLLKENCRIALVNHPIRYCCFQELETVLRFNLISSETYKIALKFLTENFSKNRGLFEANLIYRNHNDDKLNAFCEEWWTCFNHVCNRDQVTLPYLIEKHRLTPTFFFNSKLKALEIIVH